MESKCKSCKYLHAIMSYDEKGLVGDYICTANDECWVRINRLYENNEFIECIDYKHFDELRVKDNSDIEVNKYDWNEGCRSNDCTECGYFTSNTIKYPSGNCIIRNDKCVGLGQYCELFCKRGETSCMNTHVTMDMKDMQKLFIQYDMVTNENKENKDGE